MQEVHLIYTLVILIIIVEISIKIYCYRKKTTKFDGFYLRKH